jgi:hypothetical protein
LRSFAKLLPILDSQLLDCVDSGGGPGCLYSDITELDTLVRSPIDRQGMNSDDTLWTKSLIGGLDLRLRARDQMTRRSRFNMCIM